MTNAALNLELSVVFGTEDLQSERTHPVQIFGYNQFNDALRSEQFIITEATNSKQLGRADDHVLVKIEVVRAEMRRFRRQAQPLFVLAQ